MLKRRDHANEPIVNQHSSNHLEYFNRLPNHFSIAKTNSGTSSYDFATASATAFGVVSGRLISIVSVDHSYQDCCVILVAQEQLVSEDTYYQ